jgi:hypothetical protein
MDVKIILRANTVINYYPGFDLISTVPPHSFISPQRLKCDISEKGEYGEVVFGNEDNAARFMHFSNISRVFQ